MKIYIDIDIYMSKIYIDIVRKKKPMKTPK